MKAFISDRDLLRQAYDMLVSLVGDEKCDHDVNICFCGERQLISDIKTALTDKDSRCGEKQMDIANKLRCPACDYPMTIFLSTGGKPTPPSAGKGE
jgi:hypothetical protein